MYFAVGETSWVSRNRAKQTFRIKDLCGTKSTCLILSLPGQRGILPKKKRREASGSPLGFEAMLLAAKGLAMTALDVMYRPGGTDEAWAAFRTSMMAAS